MPEGRRPETSGQEDSPGAPASAPQNHLADPSVLSLASYGDPVFPSLDIDPSFAGAVVPLAPPDATMVLVGRNIFRFWPERSDESRAADALTSVDGAQNVNRQALRELHQESRRRSLAMANEFVRTRVRRLARDYAVKTPHDDLGLGTLLISQDAVPTSRRRHAHFQWAVTNGRIVELNDVRLPVGHLEVPILVTDFEPEVHVGGDEVVTLLAYVLDLLRVNPARPIAALGSVATHTNELLFAADLDAFLDAAREGKIHDVIFSRHDQKGDGLHGGVCFWPVVDSNEAIFAALSAVSGDMVNPTLRRRALTKEAYAWSSVALVLLAIGVYQVMVAVGQVPPISFGYFVLVLVVLFFVGTRLCTHRFWRIDR